LKRSAEVTDHQPRIDLHCQVLSVQGFGIDLDRLLRNNLHRLLWCGCHPHRHRNRHARLRCERTWTLRESWNWSISAHTGFSLLLRLHRKKEGIRCHPRPSALVLGHSGGSVLTISTDFSQKRPFSLNKGPFSETFENLGKIWGFCLITWTHNRKIVDVQSVGTLYPWFRSIFGTGATAVPHCSKF